ncbi:MAG TPA: tripartite tricarboxylate transporter substrate binding protein [Xanthobacteraceae bacterium]|nr:tripartite tricarboxylate transporter substrate binding protein [Xanthobacteraceae bacterium]
MNKWIRPVSMSLLAALLLFVPLGARAADWPTRPIRIIVPFGASGVTDIVTRIVFDKVGQQVGQQMIVDNRPGAGGTIAVDLAVHAPPDGYTFIMADPSGSLPANVTLYPTLKYDPRKDLTPIAILGTTGAAVTVPASSPPKTLKDLVDLAKQKPGELTYVSVGNGTPGHLNGELFSRLVGIKAVHVPYRVMSQAVTDMVAGRVSFWIVPIPGLLQHIKAGEVRALAVAGDTESPDLPGVKTVEELGFGHYDASTTYALFGPAGTPKEIAQKLHAEIAKALKSEVVQDKLRAAGVEPKIGSPEQVKAMLEERTPQWADVIKSANIRAEGR